MVSPAASLRQTIAATRPLLWLRCTSRDTVERDVSGYGHDFTVSGTPDAAARARLTAGGGEGIYFDGSNDNIGGVSLSGAGLPTGLSPRTWSIFFRILPSAAAAAKGLFAGGYIFQNGKAWALRRHDTDADKRRLLFYRWADDMTVLFPSTIYDGRTHFVSVAQHGSGCNVYGDGLLLGSDSSRADTPSNSDVWVGKTNNGENGDHWLRDLIVHDYALTLGDHQRIFRAARFAMLGGG